MRPFSKLWNDLEDVRKRQGTQIQVPVEDLLQFAEKSVVLLGQASNGLSYLRRFNILQKLMKDSRKVKTLLREKSTLLQKHDENLFGKKFRSHIVETEKSRKRTLEVFDARPTKKPFRSGPPSTPQRNSGGRRAGHNGGGRFVYKPQNRNGRNQNGFQNTGGARNFRNQQTNYSNYNSNYYQVKPMFSLKKEIAPSKVFPPLIPEEMLTNVHPWVKSLFTNDIPNVPLAGRLVHFKENWAKLTQDPEILEIIQNGYKIAFMETPNQTRSPFQSPLNQEEEEMISTEVQEMLQKGAISNVTGSCQDQFLSNLFLVAKKDGASRPVINLKTLNKFIPYKHFEMEGLHCLKYLIQQNDYLCKVDLKDAYFSVPLHNNSRKLLRFLWLGNLYELFWPGSSPKDFFQNC